VSIIDGHPVTSDNALIETHEISPDGRWIAYDANYRGNHDIYKKPLDGGSPMPITNSPFHEFQPRWSPDGTEIAFYGVIGMDERAVMVVSANGGSPVRIASGPGEVQNPAWSPSGLDLAFTANRTGRREVWLASREATEGPWGDAIQLTDFGCWPSDWTPDGNGVLCRNLAEMVVVSREGHALWRYDCLTAGIRVSSRPQFSRDGSTIYAYGIHEDGSEGIWAIPAQGGEPNLTVAFDDDEIGGVMWFSVGPDNLYVTVQEAESDIWVMDVEVER
jgi:Tol biopolymer transport system component